MTFRSDLDAALARIDVLERENRQLIDENSKLRRKRSPYATPVRKLRVCSDLDAALAHVDALGRENRRLGAENESLRAGAPPPSTPDEHKPWPMDDGSGAIMSPDQERFAYAIGVTAVIVLVILARIVQ
ncbi:MAG TPA: hypothetical protein VL326_16300 [Kofleriaceae bacterium]|jgi:hypothetical protein|nr:hypothetical protein [Kofleriaceae bacterium]